MSTADGFLNVGAAAIVHDIPKSFRGGKAGLKNELFLARVATVGLAVASAVFAMAFPDRLLGMLGVFGWGVFAASLAPIVGFGLNWKLASPAAAISSIVAGLSINILDVIYKMGGGALPYGISGGTVALLVSTTLFVGVSLYSKPRQLTPEVAEVMKL